MPTWGIQILLCVNLRLIVYVRQGRNSNHYVAFDIDFVQADVCVEPWKCKNLQLLNFFFILK